MQNDSFRKAPEAHGGQWLMTRGITVLPDSDRAAIRGKVESFETFTEGNDPWGEHDFGAFHHEGEKIFWKIDYFDLEYTYGSPDSANPAVTRRVLTVMLASEY